MAPPEKSLKFGPEHAAPTLKFGPEHSNTPEPTLPQRKAHLPITVAETTRAVLANDFAKSDNIWTNYLKVVAIRAPDNLRVGNNAAYHQLNMAMAEAYQDRSFLKIEENPEQWRQVQKNAANRAAAYFTANPAMSTGAKLDIVKSAYLMEMNRAKLPTPQENRDTTLNAYELQMNRAARDLRAVTETGVEEAGERHNALVRLRQASEEDKQGFMNWVSGSYFPQDVPQEADNFVLHGKYGARGYNDFPRYRAMLKDFRKVRGWQDNQGAAADLHMSNMRMRDRLAGARLGIDDAISSDLSQRNLVLLDPTKDEGHQLLSSFLSTSTQEELTAPVTTDAQISRFLKKHTGATKAQARVALQLDRLQSLGDQRLVDRMDPNKLWTPEQVAKLNMPAAALKEVGGFFTDLFAAYTDAVDRSGGPVQRAINKYMISGTVSGFRPDDPAAKVLSAEADNVFEGMAAVLKYLAPGSRTLKRTQALREYHQNGPGVPLVAALAGLDEKLSMGALWRDYSQAMRENIADRQFRLNDWLNNKEVRGTKGYNGWSALGDFSKMFAGMMWTGLNDMVVETAHAPELGPVFLVGELAEETGAGAIRRAVMDPIKSVARGFKIQKQLGRVMHIGGGAVSKRLRVGMNKLKLMHEAGNTKIGPAREKLLNETIASLEALEGVQRTIVDDSTAVAYLDGSAKSAQSLGSQLYRFWDSLTQLDPELGSAIDDFIGTKSTAWESIKHGWQRIRGKMPTNAKQDLGQLMSRITQDVGRSAVEKVLKRGVPADPVVGARLRATEKIVAGETPDVIRGTMDELINAGGDFQHIPGAPAQWKMMGELVEIEGQLKRDLAPQDMQRFRSRQKEIVDQLIGEPLVDEWDQSTLLILDNLRQMKGRPFLDGIGSFLNKATGGRMFTNPKSLARQASTARKIIDATTQDTYDYVTARMGKNVHKIRQDHIYRYADAKIRDQIDALEVESIVAENTGHLTIEPEQQIMQLQKKRTALANEHRAVLAGPLDQDVDMWEPGRLIGKEVSIREVANLAQDAPAIWGDDMGKKLGARQPLSAQDKNDLRSILRDRRAIIRQEKAAQAMTEVVRERTAEQLGAGLEDFITPLEEDLYMSEHPGEFMQRMATKRKLMDHLHQRFRPALERDMLDDVKLTGEVSAEKIATYRELGDMLFQQMADDPDIDFSAADLNYLRDVMGSIPDSFFGNKLRWEHDITADTPNAGEYHPILRMIKLFDNSGAEITTIFHEFGHHILSAVVDNDELVRLWQAWEKATPVYDKAGRAKFADAMKKLTSKDIKERLRFTNKLFGEKVDTGRDVKGPILEQLGVYWNNFTEWFARGFNREVRNQQLHRAQRYSDKTMHDVAKKWKDEIDHFDDSEAVPDELTDFVTRMWDDRVGVRGGGEEFITRFQANTRNAVDNLNGVRMKTLRAVQKKYGQRLPKEVETILRGPISADPDFLHSMAKRVRDLRDTLHSMVGKAERVAKRPIEDFYWNPSASRRIQDDAARAVFDRMGSDDALAMQRAVKRATTWKLEGGARDAYNRMSDLAANLQATRAAEAGVDPLTLASRPFWDQVRSVRAIMKDTETNVAIEADRMERLARTLDLMSPTDRRIISAALADQTTSVKALGDKFPRIKQYLQGMEPNIRKQTVENLETWLKQESMLQARLLESAHAAGFIDDDMYAMMRTSGYSPNLYGMFERPKLIKTKQARKVAEHVGKGSKGQSGDTTAGIDGSEMQFARDLAQWRVRVQEADGKIFDELFETEDAARTYIADQFGSEAMQNLVEDGPSFAFRTSLGQKGVLARPIGHDADVLDLLTGEVKEILTPDGKPTGRFTAVQKFSPVARLERYAQLNRDLHTHSFLESLRHTGLVITRAQADDMGLTKTGTKEMGKWASHWRPLPNDKRRFGNMADNFVHARLFTEINNMHGTYEGLRALFDGVNDMWDQLGYSDMGNLFQGVLGKLGNFDERLGGVVKFTQIAANQAAIASNIVSNFLFSSLAIGSKLFDTNNWPEFAAAMQDVFGFGAAGLRRPKVMHVPDEIYSEAVKEGLLGTSIFTRSNNPYLRNAFLRQAGLFDAPAMEKRYQRLQSLYGAALERGDDAAKLGNIKLEIDAMEQSLQHVQRGNIRKFMEWAMGTMGVMEKNTLGLPASNLNAAMREFYGKIDDFFKLATYRIARKTMPQKKAGWLVRSNMQDYANVSPVVTRLSKTPLIGGLVPSFTHEMMRITKNAIRFQPLRLMAIMGAGQAFNAVSAMQAGVSDERVRAIEDSMGIQDPLEKLIKGSTTVRFYDPRTKNLRFSVDFGDTLLPLFNFTQGYSALGRLAEGSSDPRERSPWDSAVVAAAKFAGNFIGARPLTNAGMSMVYNQDQVTGGPILDTETDQRTKWDYTRGFFHVWGKMVIPPQFPGGRHFNDVASSATAVPDPRTGRPFKQASIGRNLIRAMSNIKVRGGPASELSKALGAEDRLDAVDDRDIIQNLIWQATSAEGTSGVNAMPMYGIDRDRSELWARMHNEADPKTRERLRNQLKAMYRQEDKEITIAGRKYANNKSRFQEDRWARDRDKLGDLSGQFDGLPLRRQVEVLIGMDVAQVQPGTMSEYIEVMTTSDGPKVRWESAQDIQHVRQAQQELEAYFEVSPQSQGRMQRLREWLRYAEFKALKADNTAQGREALRMYEAGLFDYEGRR